VFIINTHAVLMIMLAFLAGLTPVVRKPAPSTPMEPSAAADWVLDLKAHLKSGWPLVVSSAVGRNLSHMTPEETEALLAVSRPHEARGSTYIMQSTPTSAKQAWESAMARLGVLSGLGWEPSSIWGTTSRFVQTNVHTDQGDSACVYTLALQVIAWKIHPRPRGLTLSTPSIALGTPCQPNATISQLARVAGQRS
jgi:hypothetical protein